VRKINIQDQLLHQARKDRLPVKIFLLKGLQLQGRITGYDMYSVLLEGQGRVQLIFKHAISTIEFPEKVRLNFDPGSSQPPSQAEREGARESGSS
jgi:host factor-I protein